MIVIILLVNFLSLAFNIVNRKANKIVHELARLTRFFSTKDWFEEPLSEIVLLLINNVTVISNE